MNFTAFKPLAGLALALAAGLAHATSATIDFSSVTPGSFASKLTEDTYTLTAFVPNGLAGTAAKREPVKGNETLTSLGFTFASATGAAFDLDSLQLTNQLNTKGGSVLLTYTLEGSSKVYFETLTLDKKTGLETFSQTGTGSDELFALNDLSSFSLFSLGEFQVDNIAVSPYAAATPAIPEPANAALLLAGLALLGSVAYRRKI
jgi:hypothetical protein